MISPFSANRDNRTREAILKGVYEENLRIVGRRANTLAKPKPFYLKKVFLTLAITAFVVLLNARFGVVPISSQSQVTAKPLASAAVATHKPVITPKPVVTPNPVIPLRPAPVLAGNTPSIPQYPDISGFKAIMDNSAMPIRSLFGLGVKTIMIDPGHGGIDRGTMGKLGTKEKNLTLDVAKRLKALLEHAGGGRYRVILTRDRDVTLPLDERVEMAIKDKADLFISIHFNYIPHSSKNIIETYYFGPSSDEKALRLAERENAGSHYGMSDFRQIIAKLGYTMKLQESRNLAASIQKELFTNMKRKDHVAYNYGVRRAPFVVLLGAEVPAVLVEVSCLSNLPEEKRLDTRRYRENIAHYLEAGILDYLNKGDIHHGKVRYARR